MKIRNSTPGAIIITGGNVGLGYECAKNIAKTDKDRFLILACRSMEKAEAAMSSIKKETGNNNIAALELDLASLESIRNFKRTFLSSDFPPLYAIVCNAGIQTVNGIKYTKDGFEETFGVNHLGHFLLVNLLLEAIVDSGRILFVSSDTHDPMQKTGMPEPIYHTAELLAYPHKSNATLSGTERYTTSKLCNVYCTYELDARIRAQTGKNIAVNAFNPGMMPGTGLARDYGIIPRLAWKYILPVLILFKRNVNTVSKSGRALASLVTNTEFGSVTGKYFDGTRQINSSELSYDIRNRKDLWKTSAELVLLKQDETILSLHPVSEGWFLSQRSGHSCI